MAEYKFHYSGIMLNTIEPNTTEPNYTSLFSSLFYLTLDYKKRLESMIYPMFYCCHFFNCSFSWIRCIIYNGSSETYFIFCFDS